MPFILLGFIGQTIEVSGIFSQALSGAPENRPQVPPERSDDQAGLRMAPHVAHPCTSQGLVEDTASQAQAQKRQSCWL